jgi:sodium/potassium-transporting ATPase subunit alpha
VREAIGHCRAAGIKVMMVTGDHPLTAEAIGRKINLMVQDTKASLAKKRNIPIDQVLESDVNAIVIHGEKVDALTEADWENIFSKEEIIFARTSPKHKLTIVKHAQSVGHIVGVTGDGVNDSPALKKADLGIAMNISGSDVSKEAAAMILIDDNFASCVKGIEQGRLIFQNLKKSIRYTITHTMPQGKHGIYLVWANLLFIAVPLPLPLSAILILLSDLGFEMFMSLSYAWDTSENRTGLMKLPPRKPVSEDSKARLKRITAEEAKGERTLMRKVTEYFSDPSDEDTLVDSDTLSWAYIEAGTIETIGCLTCYFFALWFHFEVSMADAKNNASCWGKCDTGGNPLILSSGKSLSNEDQEKALAVGQSAFYLALMIQQAFNLFICKARLTLPFGRFMFENRNNFLGVLAGAVFSFAIVYIPPFNIPFGTLFILTPWVWLIAFGFGMINFLYSIIRFLIQRARNPIKYSKDIQGLDLHPTRFSTGR